MYQSPARPFVIKGEKQEEKEQKDKNYHVTERAYGSFHRAFALPEGVSRDKIAADLSKGVLTVTLPKTAEAQKPTQKIEVNRLCEAGALPSRRRAQPAAFLW